MLTRLAHVKSNEINAFKEISDKENNKIISNFNLVKSFYKLNTNYDTIYNIYQEILNTINNNDAFNLSRLLNEFFSAFKPFLEHWNKYLNNEFETLDNFNIFNEATNIEYDSFFAYRFIYNFRNYLQHCSFPRISITAKISENGETQYSLFLDKNELLTQYNRWQRIVKIDLISQPGRIDLYPLIVTFMDCLHRINSTALNACLNFKELLLVSKEIMVYKKLIKSSEYDLALLEYKEFYASGTPKSFSIHVFPFEIAEHLIKNISVVL
ncbi:hypothetical protein [Adhaeribacter rhizoryzae]|uniref:Uncharacterized protein n=1 Tax=Adhaeribacter rhizoryzae TaxID=2607907 RepID=A0A5M6DSZ6_9BACT|nr:hypothetical protein [Adhaeribacter rhizoryzae]KAA5549260.1 hypothetical protein F0145_01305 [Adhaeribacter rhizoryzae]